MASSAPEQLYTVPEAVLFRNFELLGAQQQTRSLLLQNKTSKPVTASVSLPFTSHFRIAPSGIATSDGAPAPQTHATPPHMVVVVQPGVPCKVVVELKVPEDPNLNYVQDTLVVCLGDKVLPVPVKAVRQSLDPAGGAQLQAIINALPFWPATEELQVSTQQYMQRLNQRYNTQLQLPAPTTPPSGSSPAGSAPSSGASTRPPSQQALAGMVPAGAAGAPTVTGALTAAGAGQGAFAQSQPGVVAAGGPAGGASPAAARRTPSGSLPPDSFSSAASEGSTSESTPTAGPGPAPPTPPIIVSRPVMVQGRTAVVGGTARKAVAGAGATTGVTTSAASVNGSGSSTSANAGLRRPSSGSCSGSAGAQLAFKMGVRYFDSRGADVTASVLIDPAAWTVTDCDAATTSAAARPGSGSRPPSNGDDPSTSGLGGLGTLQGPGPRVLGAAGLSTSSGASSPAKPMLGASPSSGRTGSFSRAADGLGVGSGLGARGSAASSAAATAADEESEQLRQAALSAAMRELGLASLPPPARPGSAGPSQPPPLPRPPVDMRLRPRSGGAGLAPIAAARVSGLGGASILSGQAAISATEDSDLELDFEARLQRNIDMSMRVGGPAGTPGSPGFGRQLSGSKPSTPPMAGTRSVPLAPITAPLRRIGSGAGGAAGSRSGPDGRPGTAESQAGYGGDEEEDGLQARLQQQIDSQIGGGGRSGPGAGAAGRGPAGIAAGRQGPGAGVGGPAGGSRAAPAAAPCQRSGSGAAGAAPRVQSTSGSGSSSSSAAGIGAGAQRRAGPAGAAAAAPSKAVAGKAPPPSKEQLRQMQDAWDAL